MIIKTKELKQMLKEHGKHYTLTMYVNRYFHMTKKQLDYVLEYKEARNDKETRQAPKQNPM